MNRDLAQLSGCRRERHAMSIFAGQYPADFLASNPPTRLPAWHLVGGLDPLDASELTGDEPDDGYPVLLADWIGRDGLTCLKVKLRGNDAAWDYERLVRVGEIAVAQGVLWLTADFNCTVTDPAYVNEILDRLVLEHPRIYGMILYVEQPFPYDLEQHRIDVHSVSARKPLFMDESAHDWRLVRAGPRAGLDRRGAEDLQDADRRAAQPVLGQGARHDADGAGPDQSHAGADSARAAGRARRHDHGRGDQRHAVLSRGLAGRKSGCIPACTGGAEGAVDLSSIRGPGFGYRLDEIGSRSARTGEASLKSKVSPNSIPNPQSEFRNRSCPTSPACASTPSPPNRGVSRRRSSTMPRPGSRASPCGGNGWMAGSRARWGNASGRRG